MVVKPAPVRVKVATAFVPYCTGVTAVTTTGVAFARSVKLLGGVGHRLGIDQHVPRAGGGAGDEEALRRTRAVGPVVVSLPRRRCAKAGIQLDVVRRGGVGQPEDHRCRRRHVDHEQLRLAAPGERPAVRRSEGQRRLRRSGPSRTRSCRWPRPSPGRSGCRSPRSGG